MVVAVAFFGVSPNRVAMRGVVFLPETKARFLSRRLNALRDKPLDRRAIEERGTGRDWMEEHFSVTMARQRSISSREENKSQPGT